MYKRIRPTLDDIIEESIRRVLLEDEFDSAEDAPLEDGDMEESSVNNDAEEINVNNMDDEYVIPIEDTQFSTAEEKLKKVIAELRALKRDADAAGCILEWTYDRTENGFEARVKCNARELKISGYTFVAEVYPMVGQNFSMVVPTPQFAHDDNIIDSLKSVIATVPCAQCGRRNRKGVVLVFRRDSDGALANYGKSCAYAVFGIDVSARMKKLLDKLARLGSGGSTGGGPLGIKQASIFYPYVLGTCMYIAMYGIPEETIQTTRYGYGYGLRKSEQSQNLYKLFSEAQTYLKYKNYLENATGQNPELVARYQQALEQRRQAFPEFYQNLREAQSLEADFLNGAADYAVSMNDWMENSDSNQRMMQNWAMFLSSSGTLAKPTQKNYKVIKGTESSALPQLIFQYFIAKNSNDFDRPEEFEGEQTFNVKIINRYYHSNIYKDDYFADQYDRYWTVYAIDENNTRYMWAFEGEEQPPYQNGEDVTIHGSYHAVSRTNIIVLDNVRVDGYEPEEPEQPQEEQILQANVGADLDLHVKIDSVTQIPGKNYGKVIALTSDNERVMWFPSTQNLRNWQNGQEYDITCTFDGYDRIQQNIAKLSRVVLQGQERPAQGGFRNAGGSSNWRRYDDAIIDEITPTTSRAGRRYLVVYAHGMNPFGAEKRFALWASTDSGLEVGKHYRITGQAADRPLNGRELLTQCKFTRLNESRRTNKLMVSENALNRFICEAVQKVLSIIL